MPEDIHDRIDNDFGYHKGTAETIPLHEVVRTRFAALAHWAVDNTPPGRDQSLMLTALEDAAMRANKAIAMKAPLEQKP